MGSIRGTVTAEQCTKELAMRRHHPNNVLKVNTPVIELLCKNPAPEDLIDAVTTSIIINSTRSDLMQAAAAAGDLLSAVRANVCAPGRVIFLVHFNIESDYPSCTVALADGDITAKLYCRVNIYTDTVEVYPAPADTAGPALIVSLKNLRHERHNTARFN